MISSSVLHVTLLLYTLTTLAPTSNLWCKKHYKVKWGSRTLTCKMRRSEQAWTRAEMRRQMNNKYVRIKNRDKRQNNQIRKKERKKHINEKERKRKSKEKGWIWKQGHNERQTTLRKDFKVSGSPSAPLPPLLGEPTYRPDMTDMCRLHASI